MSDKDKPNSGNLVPAGRGDLGPVAAANPLVSRGIADMAKIQEFSNVSPTSELPDVSPSARHPFDVKATKYYQAKLKMLRFMIRVKEAKAPTVPAHIPGQPQFTGPAPNVDQAVAAALGLTVEEIEDDPVAKANAERVRQAVSDSAFAFGITNDNLAR